MIFLPLVLVGVNHKQAGLELREIISLQENEIPPALRYFLEGKGIAECFLLSTCNRTELYAICTDDNELSARFLAFFRDVKKHPPDNALSQALYVRREEEAVRHLFAVSCGLDSMVLGETQILGQVKEAYHCCQAAGATGAYLHSLCQKALATGKKVHTLTTLGQHAVSFGYAAAAVARLIFGSLQNYTLMVIGTGEMAKLTLQNLFAMEVQEVIVVSRHRERAAALAGQFQGKVLRLGRLAGELAKADVVICATQAPHYVITAERLRQLRQREKQEGKPLLLIDLAVPRNVDPDAASLEGVHLYNLDDLQSIINENLKVREHEALKAQDIIEAQVREFLCWYRSQRAVPIIAGLRRKAEQIRQAKLAQFNTAALSAREQQLADKLTRSLVNTLLGDPIMALKSLCLQDDFAAAEKYARQIFGLEPQDTEKPL